MNPELNTTSIQGTLIYRDIGVGEWWLRTPNATYRLIPINTLTPEQFSTLGDLMPVTVQGHFGDGAVTGGGMSSILFVTDIQK